MTPPSQLPETVVGDETRDAVVAQDLQRSKEEEPQGSLVVETPTTIKPVEAQTELGPETETPEEAEQADREKEDQRAKGSPGELDQANQDTQLVQEELVSDFQEGKKRVKVSSLCLPAGKQCNKSSRSGSKSSLRSRH